MPTFPLAMPPGSYASAVVRPNSVVEMNASPTTRERQIYVHQGQWWESDLVLPPLKGERADLWTSFLTKLNGIEGTFLLGPQGYRGPRGVATGTPAVNGAGETGTTLNVNGWTPGVTGILKDGDYFQVGSGATARLHRLTEDATSDGAGATLLHFWPRLRYAPAHGAVLTLANPQTVFCLTSNAREWLVEPGLIHTLRISAREAL